jgi:hypothetical protein
MSAKSSALARETTHSTAAGPMIQSASFSAHLKSIQRTLDGGRRTWAGSQLFTRGPTESALSDPLVMV